MEQEDISRTGPKPKQITAGEIFGIPVGRNKIIVPPEQVQELATLGCNDGEIARFFSINEDTLRYNFKPELAKGRAELNIKLRRAQLNLALSGNAVMLIWLGKNLLGQSDNPTNTADTKPLPWTAEEETIEIEEYTDEEIENGVQTTGSKVDGGDL